MNTLLAIYAALVMTTAEAGSKKQPTPFPVHHEMMFAEAGESTKSVKKK